MGLTYRGTSIQGTNIHLDIVSGYFDPAFVRGEDDVIPGASGRREQSRQKDRRVVRLEGWVKGTGSTLANRQASFNTNMNTLMGLLAYTSASGNLVVSATTMGLAAGTKTLSCKCINIVLGKPEAGYTFQRISVDLESIASPPDWT